MVDSDARQPSITPPRDAGIGEVLQQGRIAAKGHIERLVRIAVVLHIRHQVTEEVRGRFEPAIADPSASSH